MLKCVRQKIDFVSCSVTHVPAVSVRYTLTGLPELCFDLLFWWTFTHSLTENIFLKNA